MDITDFIDLKKNSGKKEEEHDLFPCSLDYRFIYGKSFKSDAHWTLFDPYEVKDLSECYGDEFGKIYCL